MMKDANLYRSWLVAVFIIASIALTSCKDGFSDHGDDKTAATLSESSSTDVIAVDGQAGITSQPLEFSTLGGGLGFREPVNQIIRSEDEWAALYTTYTLGDWAYIGDSPPPFPYDVDFSEHMVVIVSMGQQDKAGRYSASLSIESISVVGNVVQVRYVQRVPPEGTATLGDHVYPAHIVKTARVELAAEFIPRTETIDVK